MTERLGDAPIEMCDDDMNAIARHLDEIFNGDARGHERKIGFIFMVFPLDDHNGRCYCISNGADQRDVVIMMKEQIRRFEGQPDIKGSA